MVPDEDGRRNREIYEIRETGQEQTINHQPPTRGYM